jgi:hypothetical protein
LTSICVVGKSATTSFKPFSLIRFFNISKSFCESRDKRSTLSTNKVSPLDESSRSRFRTGLSSFVPDSFSTYFLTSPSMDRANFLNHLMPFLHLDLSYLLEHKF